MSTIRKAGAFLFVIGLLGTVFTGFNFITREKVVDIGELEIMADRNHELAWEPALGFAVMLVGGITYALGYKKRDGPTLLF